VHEETNTFIRCLFERCEERAYMTFTTIHPDGRHATPSHHVQLGNLPDLAWTLGRLTEANTRGWGAFMGIATRTRNFGRWKRGARKDLVELPALYIDIDTPDDALFRFLRFDPPPSVIVRSGSGFHAYWLLAEPTRDFDTADRTLKGLARHFASDDKMSTAQSLRLPGTYNTKPGRADALCSIVSMHEDWRYSVSDFAPYAVARQTFFRRPAARQQTVATDREQALSAVTDAVLTRLDGRPKSSGWIAARCPYEHSHDGPGQHFSFHPETGVGYCFGKHGKIALFELCCLLGVQT
jgi:hypothetical protein